MKNTKQKRKTGLLGLIEEIETKWAYHYCNEGMKRIDGKETENEYSWVESKKLARRLKRIYSTEIKPLRKALAEALDMTLSFDCPMERCVHYKKCLKRKESDKKDGKILMHCFRHEAWRKLIGIPETRA